VRGARRIGIKRGIECVAAPGSSGDASGRGPRHALRARGEPGARAVARLALLLHAAELQLELLVSVLQLLDEARELPELPFKPIKPKHQVRSAGLRGALARPGLGCRGGLRATFTGEALAAPEDHIEQPTRPLALLRSHGEIREGGDRDESKRGSPPQGEASHGRQGSNLAKGFSARWKLRQDDTNR
jgi:hypothetical protein